MNTVAIVGVGLIGGSFGLALRKAGFAGQLIGVSSPAAIAAGLKLGAISQSATLQDAAVEADLIYLAQPVDRILQTLGTVGLIASPRCLITDAGSTKRVIVEKASACVRFATFLGGHPIAGKEQRGVESADPDLFQNHTYVLTPTAAETSATQDLRSWLARIGAKIVDMRPSEHDATLAFTSHLPQLLSTALAATLARENNPRLAQVFGSGLLDMTRLALSSADLWSSILSTNKTDVTAAVDAFLTILTGIRSKLQTDELSELFTCGADFASEIRSVSRKF